MHPEHLIVHLSTKNLFSCVVPSFVELLAVPTTQCETMIKVTIKYLQKGMREAVFKNKDRNDDKLGFKNYIERT
jgi:hypothetical protein